MTALLAYSQAAHDALSVLRDPQHFQWSTVTLFALVAYLYFNEVGKRNWDLLLAALVTWGLEFLAEIANALILHFSEFSALWVIAGPSSFLILTGLNIEISMMFCVAYLAFLKMLPADRDQKILGLPNRWFFVIVNSLVCVVIEVLLNVWGVLVWDYWFWGWPHVWSVFLFAYAPSVVFLYVVYDRTTIRQKLALGAAIYLLDLVCIIIFAVVLRWI
ncbi:hypothetical protein ACFL59_05510 [Planctomycetota bacterium]